MTRKKKPSASLVRSSAAEYLTFVAASGTGGVEAVYADENVWLSQKMMAQLYDVEVPTINYHLKKVFEDSELEEDAVIRNFRITAADGKTYDTKHYNLSAIIAVGYKVNSERAVQFRKWATRVVEEFTIKGFAMDDERLKRGGSVLSDKYFEEQLQRVREIRLSERKFYQKITDIYATSVDYDVTAQATKRFFATVQNKLHWAIHGQTAAEVIVDRADATKEHMGLHTWTDAPHGKIQKFDVVVAKNYLTESELAQLSRLVNAYLDVAEDMALRKIPMTMQDWETRLNRFLDATDREVLSGRRQGDRRDRQGARRERVREVPHRAGPPLRERLRSGRGRDQAARRGHMAFYGQSRAMKRLFYTIGGGALMWRSTAVALEGDVRLGVWTRLGRRTRARGVFGGHSRLVGVLGGVPQIHLGLFAGVVFR
jgi:hypothetical protein